jgi:hypothetical protein
MRNSDGDKRKLKGMSAESLYFAVLLEKSLCASKLLIFVTSRVVYWSLFEGLSIAIHPYKLSIVVEQMNKGLDHPSIPPKKHRSYESFSRNEEVVCDS